MTKKSCENKGDERAESSNKKSPKHGGHKLLHEVAGPQEDK
jgi:hypothetical protein